MAERTLSYAFTGGFVGSGAESLRQAENDLYYQMQKTCRNMTWNSLGQCHPRGGIRLMNLTPSTTDSSSTFLKFTCLNEQICGVIEIAGTKTFSSMVGSTYHNVARDDLYINLYGYHPDYDLFPEKARLRLPSILRNDEVRLFLFGDSVVFYNAHKDDPAEQICATARISDLYDDIRDKYSATSPASTAITPAQVRVLLDEQFDAEFTIYAETEEIYDFGGRANLPSSVTITVQDSPHYLPFFNKRDLDGISDFSTNGAIILRIVGRVELYSRWQPSYNSDGTITYGANYFINIHLLGTDRVLTGTLTASFGAKREYQVTIDNQVSTLFIDRWLVPRGVSISSFQPGNFSADVSGRFFQTSQPATITDDLSTPYATIKNYIGIMLNTTTDEWEKTSIAISGSQMEATPWTQFRVNVYPPASSMDGRRGDENYDDIFEVMDTTPFITDAIYEYKGRLFFYRNSILFSTTAGYDLTTQITKPIKFDRTVNITFELTPDRLATESVAKEIITPTGIRPRVREMYEYQNRLYLFTSAGIFVSPEGVPQPSTFDMYPLANEVLAEGTQPHLLNGNLIFLVEGARKGRALYYLEQDRETNDYDVKPFNLPDSSIVENAVDLAVVQKEDASIRMLCMVQNDGSMYVAHLLPDGTFRISRWDHPNYFIRQAINIAGDLIILTNNFIFRYEDSLAGDFFCGYNSGLPSDTSSYERSGLPLEYTLWTSLTDDLYDYITRKRRAVTNMTGIVKQSYTSNTNAKAYTVMKWYYDDEEDGLFTDYTLFDNIYMRFHFELETTPIQFKAPSSINSKKWRIMEINFQFSDLEGISLTFETSDGRSEVVELREFNIEVQDGEELSNIYGTRRSYLMDGGWDSHGRYIDQQLVTIKIKGESPTFIQPEHANVVIGFE